MGGGRFGKGWRMLESLPHTVAVHGRDLAVVELGIESQHCFLKDLRC